MVDDYDAGVRWAFILIQWGSKFSVRISSPVRRTRWIALSTLTLLACVTAAIARQSATGDSTDKKPATTKPAVHKHYKRTATNSSTTQSAGKTHTASSGKRSSRKKSSRVRGQQKIDSERAQAIQEALIREHYLTGEATGTWNQASEEAMRRYQADQGWQSKTVPDSRALIKLGLGPSHERLLNPESAMTTAPAATRATSLSPVSHTAPPVAPANKTPTADPLPTTSSTPKNSSSPQ